jgi:hypothetical protein
MVDTLYIPKEFNNYADVFQMLGIATLVQNCLRLTHSKEEIEIKDRGCYYQLKFQDLDIKNIASTIKLGQLFPVIQGNKTKMDGIPTDEIVIFNVSEASEQRKLYLGSRYQQGEKNHSEIEPPDSRTQNSSVLVSMRHDSNHNSLWKDFWDIKDNFGHLASCILEVYSQVFSLNTESRTQLVTDLFKTKTSQKLPTSASAVKIYMPSLVQGINRIKADSNKSDSQKSDWLQLLFIATGFFEFAIAERVKISDRVFDWRVVGLNPQEITLDKYKQVLDLLRISNPAGGGHGIARFDAELVIKMSIEFLNHHPIKDSQEQDINERRSRLSQKRNIRKDVSGFFGTHFGSKGQVYGVKEIFSLNLPNWINSQDYGYEDLTNYIKVLQEHLVIVQSLSSDKGNTELLNAYRDFITGNELKQFFPFQILYGDYVVKKLANTEVREPRLFSIKGLNLMIRSFQKNDKDEILLTEITNNSGFKNIAQAINSATVYAGKNEKGWERVYGLAQRLGSQTASKKDFIVELMSFLASYENENLRIDEDLRKQNKTRRIWTTKEDLDSLIALIEKHGSNLVGNLLIAYGYAQGWGAEVKKQKEADKKSKDTESK